MTEQTPGRHPEEIGERAPEPAAEPATGVTPEPAPEPVAEPAPEPVAEPAPEPAAAADPGLAPAPEAPEAPQPVAVPEHPAYSTSSYPGWGVPAQPLPGPARPRRRTALLVAGALVLAAALGGGGYALYGRGDDKPVKAAVKATPKATKAYGVTSSGSHYGDLGQMLLPVPSGMDPGPDMEQHGNDTVYDAANARKVLETDDNGRKLSADERKAVDAQLDAMRIKGLALRTYTSEDGNEDIQIILIQVGNQLGAERAAKAFGQLTEGSDVKKGPAVHGYPHAVCIPLGADATPDLGDWFNSMYCQATEGDLMVQLTEVGGHPLNENLATTLMAQQLDRIKAPGESV